MTSFAIVLLQIMFFWTRVVLVAQKAHDTKMSQNRWKKVDRRQKAARDMELEVLKEEGMSKARINRQTNVSKKVSTRFEFGQWTYKYLVA